MIVVARLNIGGVALNVVQTAAALDAQADLEVVLVHGQVGAAEGDMHYLVDQHQIRTVEIQGLGRELSPRRDLATLFALWRLMRREKPDVVHTHTAKAGFVGRWAAWLAGISVRVHTFHGHVFKGYFGSRKTMLFLWLERITARITTRIVTLSAGLRDELAQEYRVAPAKKIIVLPLSLDLAPFINIPPSDFRQQHNIPPDVPLIAVVGRLVPIKNHRLFLDAAQRCPDFHFVIVGDGEMRPLIEAEKNERVHLTGWVQDMAAVYGAVDLVTITSDNEGTPVSLIEAIVAGVPVVSTDVGGVGDLLRPELTDQLVPPSNADALAQAWQRTLATPPDLTAARTRILAQYGIQVAALVAVYRAAHSV